MGVIKVTEVDGALKINTVFDKEWVEVGPNEFRARDDYDRLAFREDADGDVTHMFMGPAQIVAFEKIGWWEAFPFQVALLIGCTVLFLSALILWPYGSFLARRYAFDPGRYRVLPFGARAVGWLAAACFIGFLALFMIAMGDPMQIIFGVPPLVGASLVLPLVGAVFTLLAIGYTVYLWTNGHGRIWRRVHYTLLTAACVVFLAQLYYWNLLGFWY